MAITNQNDSRIGVEIISPSTPFFKEGLKVKILHHLACLVVFSFINIGVYAVKNGKVSTVDSVS
tara:strand:- start:633 stop:824 length:192 start_codon:yes stop_codon:yes gene_type:complete